MASLAATQMFGCVSHRFAARLCSATLLGSPWPSGTARCCKCVATRVARRCFCCGPMSELRFSIGFGNAGALAGVGAFCGLCRAASERAFLAADGGHRFRTGSCGGSIPTRLQSRLHGSQPCIRRRAPSSSRWERARAADFQVPTSAVGREARSGQGDTDRPEETRSCLQTAKSNKLIQVVFMRAVIDAVSHPPFDCLGVLTLRLSTNRTVPSGRHCQPRGWRTYTRMGMKRLRSGQGRARGLPRGAVPFHVPGVHRTARGALHHRSEVLRLYRGRVPCGTGRRRGPACRLPPS